MGFSFDTLVCEAYFLATPPTPPPENPKEKNRIYITQNIEEMKTNPSLPHYKPNQYLHNLTIFTNLTITSLFLFFHLITNLYIILLIIR